MELVTAIKTVKTVAKAAKTTEKIVKKMKELYKIDQGKRVIFNSDFYSGRFRETVLIGGQKRVVPDFRNDDFQIVDRRVTIFATGDRDPFCDASSFSPESILTIDLLRASVTHDAIYQYMEDIAKAWGWPVEDVRELADHAHGNDLQHEARKQTSAPMRVLGEVVAHVAHFCTRTFGGIYHRAHKVAPALVAALVIFGGGCAEIPQVFDPSDERPDITIITTGAASSPAEAGAIPGEGGVSPHGMVPAGDLSAYPLGLASCWGGANASERMMNILSPRMSDATFQARLDFMVSHGCTVAHVILANGGDGECAGYAAWRDSDKAAMLVRLNTVKETGLTPVPWIITDDSDALRKELFGNPGLVASMAEFFEGAPYVVLGLEMDEGEATLANWRKVRAAVKTVYSGPIGAHHTSGNSFPFASLADIVLGQLDPGCTEAQVAAQIKAIKAEGKRAVGFEYSRGPSRSLSLAALNAGAEGVGNWDGGEVPAAAIQQADESKDEADFNALSWDYGGFNGGKAALADGCEIGSLNVSASGMSYKWGKGGCESLGATSGSDYSHTLACLFVQGADGKWRGGKFDWVSTSRTTRDFKNISEGYNGWPKDAIETAKDYAFVIVSGDGRKRSNVITCGR